MQIILLENISKLGKIGDLVVVKNGYARNYLLRENKALRANKENIELVNKNKTFKIDRSLSGDLFKAKFGYEAKSWDLMLSEINE